MDHSEQQTFNAFPQFPMLQQHTRKKKICVFAKESQNNYLTKAWTSAPHVADTVVQCIRGNYVI